MKKIRVILASAACVVALGAAMASPFFATKVFVIDQNGAIIGPAAANYTCATSQLNCTRLYNVDGSGNPTTPAGPIVKGTYTPL